MNHSGRWIALGVVAFLAALGVWWLALPSAPVWLLALLLLPWLVALPGLLRGSRGALQAVTLIASCYIGLAVLEAVANPQARASASIGALICLGIFAGAVLALRVGANRPDAVSTSRKES